MPTLSRRLRHFGIKYINYETPLEAVTDAVSKELNGLGRCLGYRALNQKLRNEHNSKVPRHLVHNVLAELNPEGLDSRAVNKKIKKRKAPFSSEGPLWLVSLRQIVRVSELDISSVYLRLSGYIQQKKYCIYLYPVPILIL